MSNQIVEELGVDLKDAQQVCELVMAETFFNKLAELGLAANSEQEQQEYWELGEQIARQESKIAAAPKDSLVGRGLGLMNQITKTASSSKTAQEQQAELGREVQSKVAAYLENPEVFAHGLALYSEMHKHLLENQSSE